jgi:hypothetical protein
MSESATYSVVLSGNLKSGFDSSSVVDAFAKLFKLPPEKADQIVGTEYVVKREVDLQMAKTYKDKLAGIGVEVVLKKHGGSAELALEPVQPVGTDANSPAAPADGEMSCPKCELIQPKAEECSGCGVFIHKVLQQAAGAESAAVVQPAAAQAATQPSGDVEDPVESTDSAQPVSMKWMIAPVVVAVLGALLWYLIAIKLEYEFGAIAWLIGGAVGFAAVTSGARGATVGVICGVLVLVSICGGKYLTVSTQQAELAEILSTSLEYDGIDMQAFYQQELIDSREFLKISSDDMSLRRFMVAHEYSELTDASQVPDEDLQLFREITAPRLEEIGMNQPSFEEWQQNSLSDMIKDLSTLDMVIDDLRWIDFLFLFFGIATAYRLGSRGT